MGAKPHRDYIQFARPANPRRCLNDAVEWTEIRGSAVGGLPIWSSFNWLCHWRTTRFSALRSSV